MSKAELAGQPDRDTAEIAHELATKIVDGLPVAVEDRRGQIIRISTLINLELTRVELGGLRIAERLTREALRDH